ncbi:hypothetical protein [Pseudomonas sp. dw_358]|uniref:hypothetical protein n=1 Tax=Pseudomonas sp. dw_358 TaxID=2720083 RepID=UPI001BD64731|nr:hypothetical protein [Pseudomonas sp. dw_358]
MDEVRQLGDLLTQYAASETFKQQQFSEQCAHWHQSIADLFERIEHWFAPLTSSGQLSLARESWQASNAHYPAAESPFNSEKLVVTLAGRVVELVPEVMGAKGSIHIAVQGLTSDRHGSLSLVNSPPSADWLWRKERGAKEPEVAVLSADLLALQLQALVPKTRN